MSNPTKGSFRSNAFSRRAVLRGAGCAIALPWMESVSAMAQGATAADFPKRFGVVFSAAASMKITGAPKAMARR